MRVEIHNKNFQNWIKGVLALTTTRDALLDTLKEKLGSFILRYEESDIQTFANCLESNHYIQLKTKKQSGKRRGKVEKRTYTCEHKQCEKLFDVFVDKHKGIQKENFKWDLKINDDNTNEENRVEKNTNEHEITEENSNEENRVGENTNECELTEGKTETLWPISRLYMFDEGEHVAKYKGLDDLDISNLIKIMTSCAICEVDGDIELYNKVSTFRNKMMHSPDNRITTQYLQEKLEEASSLIQHLSTDDQLATPISRRLEDAVQYLKNLGENEFQFSFSFEEHQRVFQEAKQIIEDMVTRKKPNQEGLKQLQDLFKTITSREPTDISKKLVGRTRDLKVLVKNCIERKREALELDVALRSQEENADHEIEQLQKLLLENKQDWNDINEELKKTEDEDLTNLLECYREETTTIKAERDKALQNNADLNRENESLRRNIRDLESKKMATAAPIETYNDSKFLVRLQTLVIEGGTEVLRNIFDQRLQNQPLNVVLASERSTINRLRTQNTLTRAQYDSLYPRSGQLPTTLDLDITLLVCLLQHLPSLGCNLNYNWNVSPQTEDTSVEADVCRLRVFRDEIAHISLTTGFQQSSFEAKWREIKTVLLRLDQNSPTQNFSQTIDSYKCCLMVPAHKHKIRTMIAQWQERDRGFETDMPLMRDLSVTQEYVQRINKDIYLRHGRTEEDGNDDLDNSIECIREEKEKLKTESDKAFQSNADRNRKNESLIQDFRDLESKEKRKKTKEEDHVNWFEHLRRDNSKTERDKAFQNNDDVNRKSESLRRDIRDFGSKKMATAAPITTYSDSKFLVRLQTLVIEGGTEVLRNIFDQRLQNQPLNVVLASERSTINRLRTQNTLTRAQYDSLYPRSGQLPTTLDLDITLLVCLLQHLPSLGCNLNYNWNVSPQTEDTSVEADVCRLRVFRDEIAHISSTTRFQHAFFEAKWREIETVLLRLDQNSPTQNFSQTIDSYKYGPMDPANEHRISTMIKQWKELDLDLEKDVYLIKEDLTDNMHEDAHGRTEEDGDDGLENFVECILKEKEKLKTESDKAFQKNADRNRKNKRLIQVFRHIESKTEDPGARGQPKEIEIERLKGHLRIKGLEVQVNELEIDSLKKELNKKKSEEIPKMMEIDTLKRKLREKEREKEVLEARKNELIDIINRILANMEDI